MDQTTMGLLVFVIFWVGVTAGYLAMRFRANNTYDQAKAGLLAEQAAFSERLRSREAQVDELRVILDHEKKLSEKLLSETRHEADRRATAEAKLDVAKSMADAKSQSLEQAQAQLMNNFQALAADALKNNNQTFLDLAGQTLSRFQQSALADLEGRQNQISAVLAPIKESLDKVDERIIDLEKARTGAYAGLVQQVQSLAFTQAQLHSETANLVNALRAPATRGRWGEIQLRRVVEMAGMLEYCDFQQQLTLDTEQGRIRPDMIVKLPNDRCVVVDSKVSLSAYLEAIDAVDLTARTERMQAHAQQIRTHLTRLSSKSYWDQFQQSPEFVVAFLPGEIFFSAALEQDPSLIEFGVERRVILATPTTLIALLKAVAYGWKQEKMSANAEEIRDLGKALYERLRVMAEHFEDVHKNLDKTNLAFNRAVATLETRVLSSARRFKELGAGTGDEIPAPLPVETTPRAIQAPDLLGNRNQSDLNALEQATINFPQ